MRFLRQGARPASVYATEFRQLVNDVAWNETALLEQFHWGLRDDVKDLPLTLPDPNTLNEAISNATRCDNRIQERKRGRLHPLSSTPSTTQNQASRPRKAAMEPLIRRDHTLHDSRTRRRIDDDD